MQEPQCKVEIKGEVLDKNGKVIFEEAQQLSPMAEAVLKAARTPLRQPYRQPNRAQRRAMEKKAKKRGR